MEKLVIEFSRRDLLIRYALPLLSFFIWIIIKFGKEGGTVYLLNTIIYVFIYTLFIQYEYKIVELDEKTIKVRYPINFLLKKREIQISSIDLVEYRLMGRGVLHPFFKVHLINGSSREFTLHTAGVKKIISKLNTFNLKIEEV